MSYTAQIRKTVDGQKYNETKTSADLKFVELWALKREAQLSEPGAIERERHAGTNLGMVLQWYLEDFQGASKFGRSKLSHISYLINDYEFAELDAVKLTPAQLIQHARRRGSRIAPNQSKPAGPSTINNDFIWLRNAMRAVRLTRGIPVNVQAVDDAVGLLRQERVVSRSNSRDRRPTRDELDSALTYLSERDGRATIPMVDVVLFALFSGRRQEEICRIQWKDLDERRRGVLVRQMKHPRKKVDTFVFLTEEAWAIIQRQSRVSDEIFPYVSKSISAAFTRVTSFLEIDDLRFHDLRHECVSWLFERGWDIPRVAGVSGHKSWGSLQRYTHLRESEPYDKYQGWPWRWL